MLVLGIGLLVLLLDGPILLSLLEHWDLSLTPRFP